MLIGGLENHRHGSAYFSPTRVYYRNEIRLCVGPSRKLVPLMDFHSYLNNHTVSVLCIIAFYLIFGVIRYCGRNGADGKSILIAFSLFLNISHLNMPAKSIRQILFVGGLLSSFSLMLSFQCNYSSLAVMPIYSKPPQSINELTARAFQLSGEATVLSTLKDNKVVSKFNSSVKLICAPFNLQLFVSIFLVVLCSSRMKCWTVSMFVPTSIAACRNWSISHG